MDEKMKLGLASCVAGATAALATMALMGAFGKNKGKAEEEEEKKQVAAQQEENKRPTEMVAVIGDVGGTNVRLTLRKLCLRTRTSTEIKPLTKINSQKVKDFATALAEFLSVSASPRSSAGNWMTQVLIGGDWGANALERNRA